MADNLRITREQALGLVESFTRIEDPWLEDDMVTMTQVADLLKVTRRKAEVILDKMVETGLAERCPGLYRTGKHYVKAWRIYPGETVEGSPR